MKLYKPEEAYRVSRESAKDSCPRWATVAIVLLVLFESRPMRGKQIPAGMSPAEWRFVVRSYVDELRVLIKLPRRRERRVKK